MLAWAPVALIFLGNRDVLDRRLNIWGAMSADADIGKEKLNDVS